MLIASVGAAARGLIACAGHGTRALMASVGWHGSTCVDGEHEWRGLCAARERRRDAGDASRPWPTSQRAVDERVGISNDGDRAAVDVARIQATHHACDGGDVDRHDECDGRRAGVCGRIGAFHRDSGLFVVVGGVLLLYGWHLVGAQALPPEDFDRNQYADQNTDQSTRTIRATGATALLALFAGLSSGSLARFQLYAICGMSGAQPMWQILLSVGAVCALAFIADRPGNNNRMLIVLYVLRAALIGALAAVDSPSLALLAAKIFLILDCLTIPALMKLRRKSRSALSAGCPGAAHHIGMVLGATLSTTPYFFGDGFIVLYALSAIANLICAGTLATNWFEGKAHREHLNHYPARQTLPTSTKCESGSMTPLSRTPNV